MLRFFFFSGEKVMRMQVASNVVRSKEKKIFVALLTCLLQVV